MENTGQGSIFIGAGANLAHPTYGSPRQRTWKLPSQNWARRGRLGHPGLALVPHGARAGLRSAMVRQRRGGGCDRAGARSASGRAARGRAGLRAGPDRRQCGPHDRPGSTGFSGRNSRRRAGAGHSAAPSDGGAGLRAAARWPTWRRAGAIRSAAPRSRPCWRPAGRPDHRAPVEPEGPRWLLRFRLGRV